MRISISFWYHCFIQLNFNSTFCFFSSSHVAKRLLEPFISVAQSLMLKNLFVIHSKIFQRCLLQLHMRSDSETLTPSDKPLHGFASWRCSTSYYQIFRALRWDGWDPQDAGHLNSLQGINIPLPSLLLSFNFKFTFRLCLVLFSHMIFIIPLICLLRKSL